MDMLTDVAIVGGGPIGLATARAAAECGARTIVFERNHEGAPPSCCTGLVSPRTLPTLGVSDDSVLREIRALRIHLPSGRQIDLRSDEVKAVTIDRTRLEEELLLHSREAGADIRFEAEVIGAKSGNLLVRSGSEIRRSCSGRVGGSVISLRSSGRVRRREGRSRILWLECSGTRRHPACRLGRPASALASRFPRSSCGPSIPECSYPISICRLDSACSSSPISGNGRNSSRRCCRPCQTTVRRRAIHRRFVCAHCR